MLLLFCFGFGFGFACFCFGFSLLLPFALALVAFLAKVCAKVSCVRLCLFDLVSILLNSNILDECQTGKPCVTMRVVSQVRFGRFVLDLEAKCHALCEI